MGAFVAFLPRLFFTSLSLSLSRRKSDMKQKGPKKKRDRDALLCRPFSNKNTKKHKEEDSSKYPSSQKNEGLIIINRQKHRAPKPLEEEDEDEDGTQTLLETVRVLHRALPTQFFRFCTGALQCRLRAARVLDRHRRIEIRELARVVRGLSFSFFFRCAFRLSALFLLCAVLRMMISSLFGMRS